MTLNILIGQDDVDLQQAPIETVFAADCAFVDQAENVDLFFSASDNVYADRGAAKPFKCIYEGFVVFSACTSVCENQKFVAVDTDAGVGFFALIRPCTPGVILSQ